MDDAIKCSQRHVENETFVVLLDHSVTKSRISCTRQLTDINNRYNSSVVSLREVSKENAIKYRIIDGREVDNNIYTINRIVNRPQDPPSNLEVMGRYILTPDIFDKIDQTKVGLGGEIHLTDALSR